MSNYVARGTLKIEFNNNGYTVTIVPSNKFLHDPSDKDVIWLKEDGVSGLAKN